MYAMQSRAVRTTRIVARCGAVGAALMLVVSTWTWFAPAQAATEAGPAQVVTPGSSGGQPLASGGSATDFTLKLPNRASCAGDSANDGWRWQTYIVPDSVDPGTLRFGSTGPTPSGLGANFRAALYTTEGSAVVNRNTDNKTPPSNDGPILGIPAMDFAVWDPGNIGPGRYNVGIACTLGPPTSETQVDRFWNTHMTFTTDPSDSPAQVRWTSEQSSTTTTTGQGSTTTTAPGATTTTTAPGATTTTTAPGATPTTTAPGATTTTTAPGATTTTTRLTTTTVPAAGTTTTTTPSGAMSLDPSSGGRGTAVTAQAGSYRPNSPAQIFFLSDPVLLTTVTADGSGVVRATFPIPSNASAGAHTVEIRGTGADGAPLTKSAPFTVTTALPRTGSAVGTPVIWASLLVVLGGLAMVLARGAPGRHARRGRGAR